MVGLRRVAAARHVQDSRRDTPGVKVVDDRPALIVSRRRRQNPEAVVNLASGGHVDGKLDSPHSTVLDLADQGVPHARPIPDAVEVARPLDTSLSNRPTCQEW